MKPQNRLPIPKVLLLQVHVHFPFKNHHILGALPDPLPHVQGSDPLLSNSLVVSNLYLVESVTRSYLVQYISVSVGLEELLLDHSSVQPRSQATPPSFPGHSSFIPRPPSLCA